LSQLRDMSADGLVKRLAEECGDDLVRFISRRVRTSADARDIAQEAYVRLLRLERKDLIRDPRSYLYRIAANVLYEFELKRKADAAGRVNWLDDQNSDEMQGRTDATADALSLHRKLQAVLAKLSPKCRAVLILHRRDGLTYEEIGKRIGISVSMVKKYLIQGLQTCRAELKDFR
jgi:RNA polymerase sigma factor (sigma-70 family)